MEKHFLGSQNLRNGRKHSISPMARKSGLKAEIGATAEILEVEIFDPLFLTTSANFGKLKTFFFEWWPIVLTILPVPRYYKKCFEYKRFQGKRKKKLSYNFLTVKRWWNFPNKTWKIWQFSDWTGDGQPRLKNVFCS